MARRLLPALLLVATAALAPSPARAADECLNRPSTEIHTMPGGTVTSREFFTTPAGVGGTYIWPSGSLRYYGMGVPFPASGPMPNPQPDPRHPGGYASNPNDNKYPVYLNTSGGTVCIIGLKVQGQQHRELFWNVLKSYYDGDGSHTQGSGHIVVRNLWTDNVEDGYAPRGPSNGGGALTTMDWEVHSSYARYNRDDWLENDAMFNGVIDDVLIDGTFVFFSARPNTGGRNYSIDINKALVHMQDLPYNGDMGMHPGYDTTGNVAHAQLFKMATAGTPTLTVTDSIFYIDPHTDPVPNAWAWPKGSYTNVTLVWTASKPFWAAPPAGVTITNDVSVWTTARAAWLANHGCDSAGDNCTWSATANPLPPNVTSLALASDRVNATATLPAGDLYRWRASTAAPAAATWDVATDVGAVTTNAYVLLASLPTGTKTVLVKLQDTAGQLSAVARKIAIPIITDAAPPAPTSLAVVGTNVVWTATPPPDFAVYQLRTGATAGVTFDQMGDWQTVTTTSVPLASLPPGTVRVGVALVDAAGQLGPPLVIDASPPPVVDMLPPDVALAQTPDRIAFSALHPADFAGYRVRTSSLSTADWASATPLALTGWTGGLDPSDYVLLTDLPPRTVEVLVKMQDTAGQQSANAASIVLTCNCGCQAAAVLALPDDQREGVLAAFGCPFHP